MQEDVMQEDSFFENRFKFQRITDLKTVNKKSPGKTGGF